MKSRITKHRIAIFLALVLGLSALTLMAQDTSSKSTTGTSAVAPAAPKAANSAADIAAAKASGKVWVNLDSGIYHKGGRWYGKTKNGKFMTEADAKKAGYKTSKRN
jgi:hypothetical protein